MSLDRVRDLLFIIAFSFLVLWCGVIVAHFYGSDKPLSDASNILTAVAAISAVAVAYFGLSTWKSQHSANSDFQIAQAAYAAIVRHEMLIDDVRRWWEDSEKYWDEVDEVRIERSSLFKDARDYRTKRENYRRFKEFEEDFADHRFALRMAQEKLGGATAILISRVLQLELGLKDKIWRGYPGLSDDVDNHFVEGVRFPYEEVFVRGRPAGKDRDPFEVDLRRSYKDLRSSLIEKMKV